MKKLLMLSALVLTVGAAPALAGDYEGKGDHKGKMFEKHDTNGDGVISKEEFLDHATNRFSEMDANDDGEVSKEEAKAAHDKMREQMKKWKEKKAAE